ncbi:hypothetical protein B296_00008799 [Ensete ventricosum]|uniref:Uncharacterized protein n=1 Tax=Ensete ventricosum TaxID=4639 RepID=A0A427ABD5_ENSVE|nr:hypothetical protein B296_00008799 [Ensete ventricosum]
MIPRSLLSSSSLPLPSLSTSSSSLSAATPPFSSSSKKKGKEGRKKRERGKKKKGPTPPLPVVAANHQPSLPSRAFVCYQDRRLLPFSLPHSQQFRSWPLLHYCRRLLPFVSRCLNRTNNDAAPPLPLPRQTLLPFFPSTALPSSRASLPLSPPASPLSLSSAATLVELCYPVTTQPRHCLPCRSSRSPLPSLTTGCRLLPPTPIADAAAVLLQSPLLPAAFPPTIATAVIFLSSFPAAAAAHRCCPLPRLPLPPLATSVPLFPLLLSNLFQLLPSSLAATTAPLCSTCTLLPLPLQPPQPPPQSHPPLPPRPHLFLPSAPHGTTASSLTAAALTAAIAFKCAPALLSSQIAAASHSSTPATTSATTLTARHPLAASNRANSLCSNHCPSPTMQTQCP